MAPITSAPGSGPSAKRTSALQTAWVNFRHRPSGCSTIRIRTAGPSGVSMKPCGGGGAEGAGGGGATGGGGAGAGGGLGTGFFVSPDPGVDAGPVLPPIGPARAIRDSQVLMASTIIRTERFAMAALSRRLDAIGTLR